MTGDLDGSAGPTDRGSLVARRPRLTLAIAIVAGVGVSAILQTLPRHPTLLTLTPVVRAVLSDPRSPAAGSPDPDVTIVVFTDYQCPICRADDPALERLLRRDPKVRVIFKDWPIFGALSNRAARAALAADRQGGYLALHQAMMTSRVRLDADAIQRIAAGAGLDVPRLAEDEATDGGAIDTELGREATQAWTLGLQGTPAYLVGPYLYQGGLDDRHLALAVAQARKSGPPT
jgi:protein-disulfide isomerase